MSTATVSKSEKLKDFLLKAIEEGRFKPGDCMPSDNDLTKAYGVSRTTVRDAMSRLVSSGRLERIRGKGTFVRSLPPPLTAKPICLLAYGIDTVKSSNPFVEELLIGIHAALADKKVPVYVSSIYEGQGIESFMDGGRIPEEMRGGVIFAGHLVDRGLPEAFRKESIPFVCVGRPNEGIFAPCVDADHFAGGYMAAEALIRAGHRRIAMLDGFPEKRPSCEQRQRGISRAFSEAGFERDPGLSVAYSLSEIETGRECVRSLLARGARFSAMLIYGFAPFIGAYLELRKSGLSVPGDVSLVQCMGYTKLLEAMEAIPCAVMQPLREMGGAAVEMLLGPPSPESRLFMPSFLEGQTMGAPKGGVQ